MIKKLFMKRVIKRNKNIKNISHPTGVDLPFNAWTSSKWFCHLIIIFLSTAYHRNPYLNFKYRCVSLFFFIPCPFPANFCPIFVISLRFCIIFIISCPRWLSFAQIFKLPNIFQITLFFIILLDKKYESILSVC